MTMGYNYYFQYDTTSGKIYPYLQMQAPASSSSMGVLGPYPQDTASSDVVMAYHYSERYLVQNGALVLQPYWTLSATNGTPAAGQYTQPVTITATLNHPPTTPPATATFTIFGQTYTATVTNNQATLTVNVHPAVANQTLTVTVSATGTVQGFINIGSTTPSTVALQAFTSNGSTTPQIAPVGAGSEPFLSNYWTAQAVSQAYSMADIQTALALLLDAVFNLLGTQLNAAADPNQKNAIADIKANILPALQTTLENAAPQGTPQTYDNHYSHLSTTMQHMKTAMQNYGNDKAVIPGLAP